VITSTRAIVIGLLPGLFPGLAVFVLRRHGRLHRQATLLNLTHTTVSRRSRRRPLDSGVNESATIKWSPTDGTPPGQHPAFATSAGRPFSQKPAAGYALQRQRRFTKASPWTHARSPRRFMPVT
jgi:hypothetical protein